MFSSPRNSLMTLLRLLQHDLSADEGLAVREQLAASLELARQFHRLSEMLAQPVPPENLLAHADQIGADKVADFVDGAMSVTEESEFVRLCLDSPSLLRELFAVLCTSDNSPSAAHAAAAAHSGVSHPSDPDRDEDLAVQGDPASARFARPDDQQLLELLKDAQFLAADVPAQSLRPELAASRTVASSAVATQQPAEPHESTSRRGRASTSHRPRRSNRLALTAGALLATAALVTVLIPVLVNSRPVRPSRSSNSSGTAIGRENLVSDQSTPAERNQIAPPGALSGRPSAENIQDRDTAATGAGAGAGAGADPDPTTASNRQRLRDGQAAAMAPVEDNPASASASASASARGVPRPVPQPADPAALARIPVPADVAESLTPTPPLDSGPLDSPPTQALAGLVTGWRDVDGVVGIRESSAGIWRGILSRAVLSLNAADSDLRVITLGSSRVVGDLPLEAELIIDANTSLGLGRTVSGQGPPLPEYSVGYGRFALARLRRGTRFSIRAEPSPITLDIEDDDAAVSVEKSGDAFVIAVWRGRARLGSQALSRRQWAVVGAGGGVGELRAPANAVDWYRRRTADRSLPEQTTDPFNRSEDLLASARQMADMPEMPVVTQLLAAQLRMELSVNDRQPMPRELVQSMAGSPDEAHRTWLIQWILTAISRTPARQEQLLGALLDEMDIGNSQRIYLRQWFTAAANGHRPTTAHLAQLSRSLQNQTHVFERQCAKYFLQQILNEPLADYDPGGIPERATLERIRRRIRLWQQINMP